MFFEAPAIGGYAPIRWSRRAIARQAIRAPIALFRPLGSIRAFSRPISPSGLNTGSGAAMCLHALRAYAALLALGCAQRYARHS